MKKLQFLLSAVAIAASFIANGQIQQTTTTTTTTSSPDDNVNVNMNINGIDMNMNVNGGVQSTTTHSSTTTTTTTSSAPPPPPAGVPPCPAMDAGSFSDAKASISSKSFEDSKLTMAKQILESNCVFTTQVKDLMLLFSFEETKLDFAKFAYDKTVDRNNYFKVNDAFTFESSIDELNKYISSRR